MSKRADGRIEPDPAALLTEVVMATFHLNGAFLRAADRITEPESLTTARWQVLGAVLPEPLSVAEIARSMGLARQSVQRTADILVGEGMAEYLKNPVHQRAKLFAITPDGRSAVRRLATRQRKWASATVTDVDTRALAVTLRTLQKLVERSDESTDALLH